jgi:hypothetical protein
VLSRQHARSRSRCASCVVQWEVSKRVVQLDNEECKYVPNNIVRFICKIGYLVRADVLTVMKARSDGNAPNIFHHAQNA